MKKLDPARLRSLLIRDLPVTQQTTHRRDILAQLTQRTRRQPHRPPRTIAGPQPEDDSSGGKLINRGNGMGSHGRTARADHRHPGSEGHSTRVLRHQPQTQIHIPSHHGRVFHPHMAEALCLGQLGVIDTAVRFGKYQYAEIHTFLLSIRPREPTRPARSVSTRSTKRLVFSVSFPRKLW